MDDKKIEDIARVCHEANRAYCLSLGDKSQLSWDDAEEWQRKSALHGVRHALENPDAPASASHDNWLKLKIEDGWTFGPLKDVEKKEHPCCVPYGELPEEQRRKDHLFKAVVRAMSEAC